MEYFGITFKIDEEDIVALVIKRQSPEEIVYYAHINRDIAPLKNPQQFSFVDGAFNEALPDKLEGTPGLRKAIWTEIYKKEQPVLTERANHK
ncbi:MAG: hypothetical protein KF746_20430 [Chitinophagaceae bacterium]|nr:hypothetical protein [Chitinophagaceae bacterium]